ncbi:family 43 glycosylhydrolase [Puniceicoccales bacterium CK1056]|uniref:Family 43 glycosylhydrolase n=1 Tax=Oceanipulchritudo coccoides TaxID=2706888 RepID=A0A6B2M5A2_9BACT|nr:glycoside hydrolase family 43 protein [Oceanipulchritudo coccoides]NDV63412.1 family 43 glycosylhydrolase [Oceanipulchritudo coccoides]
MRTKRYMQSVVILAVTSLMALGSAEAKSWNTMITSGTSWEDTAGDPIQAHGGGLLKHGDLWYWYGEDKRNGYFPSPGVSCYSSNDLINWKNEGVVCPIWVRDGESIVPNTPAEFQSSTRRAVMERPKVIYNDKTKKFLMWVHLEGYADGDPRYQISSAGVAFSDSPVGPFEFVDFFRPVPAELHKTFCEETSADQMVRGSTFRDMTLFKDDDGRAYVIYAAESNYTMHIIELTDDFCGVKPLVLGKTWNRILIGEHREAPAMFKYRNNYYILTSGATGWTPNAARMYTSGQILGPYSSLGNPCLGELSETTFNSQSTFVQPLQPDKGIFLYMGDRWTRDDLGDSRYIWLPLTFDGNDQPVLRWKDSWSPSSLTPQN